MRFRLTRDTRPAPPTILCLICFNIFCFLCICRWLEICSAHSPFNVAGGRPPQMKKSRRAITLCHSRCWHCVYFYCGYSAFNYRSENVGERARARARDCACDGNNSLQFALCSHTCTSLGDGCMQVVWCFFACARSLCLLWGPFLCRPGCDMTFAGSDVGTDIRASRRYATDNEPNEFDNNEKKSVHNQAI